MRAPLLQKIFGVASWKPEWQNELSGVLRQAQAGLPVNMVVIIARESDLYAELLFLLSFVGLSLGSIAAYLTVTHGGTWYGEHPTDLLGLPMAGFALGATLYSFRRYFLRRLAPKAIRDRVDQRARSQFYEHSHQLKDHLTLIYFSEMEQRSCFLSSEDLSADLPHEKIVAVLHGLERNYRTARPLVTLGPCLIEIGALLRSHLRPRTAGAPPQNPSPIFTGASDRVTWAVPVLKGNKDIN